MVQSKYKFSLFKDFLLIYYYLCILNLWLYTFFYCFSSCLLPNSCSFDFLLHKSLPERKHFRFSTHFSHKLISGITPNKAIKILVSHSFMNGCNNFFCHPAYTFISSTGRNLFSLKIQRKKKKFHDGLNSFLAFKYLPPPFYLIYTIPQNLMPSLLANKAFSLFKFDGSLSNNFNKETKSLAFKSFEQNNYFSYATKGYSNPCSFSSNGRKAEKIKNLPFFCSGLSGTDQCSGLEEQLLCNKTKLLTATQKKAFEEKSDKEEELQKQKYEAKMKDTNEYGNQEQISEEKNSIQITPNQVEENSKPLTMFEDDMTKEKVQALTMLHKKKKYEEETLEDEDFFFEEEETLMKDKEKKNMWQVLEDGEMFKKIIKEGTSDKKPTLDCNVTISFTLSTIDDTLLLDNTLMNTTILEFPLKNAMLGVQSALKTMRKNENSIFLLGGKNTFQKDLSHNLGLIKRSQWIKLNVTLCNFYNSTLSEEYRNLTKLFGHLPFEEPTNKTNRQILEEKAEQLKEIIRNEMESNPASPLWNDVKENLTEKQVDKTQVHFTKQFDLDVKPDQSKIGSRGYVENFLKTGNINGVDDGRKIEGRGKFYVWKETHNNIELAFPVHPGVRAKHVKCAINYYKMVISIVKINVFEDEFFRLVDEDAGVSWAMSDATMNYEPLSEEYIRSNKLHNFQRTKSLQRYDEVSKLPSILIFVKKALSTKGLWGCIFEKN